MQIKRIVVAGAQIDMVDDLARFGPGDFPVLPLAAASFTAVAEAVRFDESGVRPIRPFGGWIDDRCRFGNFSDRRHHSVSAPLMFAVRKTIDFLGVCVQGIAMTMPHLVMANAHFSRGNRAITVFASAANHLAAPAVLGRTVFLDSLVVHKAKAICSMFPTATINAANLVKNWRRHVIPVSLWLPKLYHDKALGNSMCVNVMAFIGRRIQQETA